MESLFAGLTTLSLNPAPRLEELREERTVTVIRAKMDPRFATSQAAARRLARIRKAQRRATLKRPRTKVS